MFCSKCGTKLTEEAMFCFKCGNKLQQEKNEEVVIQGNQQLQVKTEEYKEYLQYAKTLEVNRYTLNKTIEKLDRKILTLGHAKEFGLRKVAKAKHFLLPFFITVTIMYLLFGITGVVSSPIVLFLVMFFAGVIVGAIYYFVLDDKYYKEHQKILDADKQRVQQEKRQIEEIKKQQDDLNHQIDDISELLTKLYSLNVLYPKYRELVPVVTMWEYIDSGRCVELAGADGAYNLYESESRQNIIISNLNKAISLLAQIRDNQYALYEAIEESNAISERMCYQTESLLASNKSIANNAEIAAYNSKLTADNTTISSYIDFCKF